MKVCFPVSEPRGLDSEVYGHFGSAPAFLIVESEDKDISVLVNKDQNHTHGMCNPLKALDNQKIEAIVVGGIGAGALSKLHQSGIKVFRADAPTIRENLDLLDKKSLSEFTTQQTCAGHAHGGGCGH